MAHRGSRDGKSRLDFTNRAFTEDEHGLANGDAQANGYAITNGQLQVFGVEDESVTDGKGKSEITGGAVDEDQDAFRSLVPFCFVFGLGSMFSQSIATYLSSQITVIEKAFGLSSSKSGFLLSANDIGFCGTILFASHFLKNHHIPRILALCILIFGLSGILTSVPHFISGEHRIMPSASTNGSGSNPNERFLCAPARQNGTETECSSGVGSKNDDQSVDWVIVLIAIAMMIQGIAKAPRTPLSNLYIDSNSPRTSTGFYLGLMMAFTIFGPFLAITLGGVFNKIPVDLKDTTLEPEDPRWIGAWWLGFVVFGACAVCISVPVFFFPASLRRTAKEQDTNTSEYINASNVKEKKKPFLQVAAGMPRSVLRVLSEPIYTVFNLGTLASLMALMSLAAFGPKYFENQFRIPTWKANVILGMPRSVLRVVSEPIYVIFSLGALANLMAYMALGSFGPKYYENQFRLPTWKANVILGLEKLLTTSMGTLLGGVISRRLRLDLMGCVKMVAIVRFLGLIAVGFNFIFGCDNPEIIGFDTENSISSNVTCQCSDSSYLPVCADGLTYFSPCHAGCQVEMNNEYTMCAASTSGSVHPGTCETGCKYLIPFVALNGLSALVMTTAIAPSFVIYLRSVPHKDRAMGVGLHSFLLSLLVFLPAPIIFGKLFDTMCLVWDSSQSCSGSHSKSGACSLYDVRDMRLKFVSVDVALKALSVICAVITLFLVRRKLQKEQNDTVEVVVTKPPVPQPRTSIGSKDMAIESTEDA